MGSVLRLDFESEFIFGLKLPPFQHFGAGQVDAGAVYIGKGAILLVLKRWSIIYVCPFTITARTLLDFDVRDFKLFLDAFFALSVVPAALVVSITRKPVLFSAACRGDIVLDRVRRVNDGVVFVLASSVG